MRSVLLKSISIGLSFLLLAACGPAPTATSVAMPPAQTPTPEPSVNPTSTYTAMPTATSTPTRTATPTVTGTQTPTPTDTSTPTPTRTSKPTRTPRPTSTPLRELTPSDVGLPFDPNLVKPTYIPCYVFTDSIFHAGDGIIFDDTEGQTYYALAPIEGQIIEAGLVNSTVGHEITVKTPYVYQGKRVYYDLVHSNGLVPGLKVGDWIKRGTRIAIMDRHYGGGGLKDIFLDVGIRNGPKGANPTLSNWHPYSYFSFLEFVEDDLQQLPPETYQIAPMCSGNPISEENQALITPTAPTP